MIRVRLRLALLAATVVWLSHPDPTLACSTCFGQADGPLIDAAQMGTWLLLGVVLCVQVAFAAFFLYLRRQAARVGRNASEGQWSGDTPGRPGEWRSA
jgi:hypothetical protein